MTGSRRAQLSAELAFLKREAVKLNTPSTYAKCAKYQRLANSKEKELKELSAPGAVPTVPERLVLLCNTGKVRQDGAWGAVRGRNCMATNELLCGGSAALREAADTRWVRGAMPRAGAEPSWHAVVKSESLGRSWRAIHNAHNSVALCDLLVHPDTKRLRTP